MSPANLISGSRDLKKNNVHRIKKKCNSKMK